MPINRGKYPSDWSEISKRVREERGNLCQFCKVPNGQVIHRTPDHWFDPAFGQWRKMDGSLCSDFFDPVEADAPVGIVLTVAHLNHDTSDNREINLAPLCQRCRLRYDRQLHQKRAQATRFARKAAGTLTLEENA